jgi:DNA-binding transcriptional LysR family regulator
VTDLILKQAGAAIHLDRVYETDMAEGLKVMALEGHGIAFLPFSAVHKEVAAHKLAPIGWPDAGSLQITMEVRAYRAKPSAKQVPKHSAQALWVFLTQPQAPH